MTTEQRPDERIAAIRERREGIPSPPWLNNTGEFVSQAGTYMAICRVNTPVVADWLRGKTVGGTPYLQSLKEFIANAPTDIDYLLQHITTLTAERDAAQSQYVILRTAVERNSCSDCGQVEPDVIEALRDQANAVRAHSGYDPGAAYDATADAIISALATTPADAPRQDITLRDALAATDGCTRCALARIRSGDPYCEAHQDAIDAALAGTPADAPAAVWHPFATAPQDGTEILVYRPDAGVFMAVYTYPVELECPDNDERCWFTVEGSDLTGDLPTHWTPKPAGPSDAAAALEEEGGIGG